MTRIASPKLSCCSIAIVLLSVFAMTAGAQTASVRLEGITWNPSGDPIAGVMLTAVEEATGRQFESASDSEGYYRFLALPPGIYTVTAKTKEFKDVVHRGIRLYPPDTITENFSFEVSAIDKDVPVGDATRANDAASSGAFPRSQIDLLPIVDPNPLRLLVYQPGVQINGGEEDASTVNGTRKGMNRLFLDGISLSDPVNPGIGSPLLSLNTNSIENLQIVTSGAKAEFGGSGGGYFVLSSRAGSRSWNGSVYDYFRNRNMDANEFFLNSSGLPRQGLTRNIFGGTVSGPLGNRTLLFAGVEFNRTNRTRHVNTLILREDARAGLFQWYEPNDFVRDETTVRTFDIPANDPRGLGIDPTAAAQIALFPGDGDLDDDEEDYINYALGDGLNTGGFLFESPAHSNQERLSVRLDRNVNARHNLFFRFNWQHADATDTQGTGFATYVDGPVPEYKDNGWTLAGGSDWAIGPAMVNELRIGYTRPEIKLERPGRLAGPMAMLNSWTNQQDVSFPSSYRSTGFDIADTLSQSRGVHSLKYGAAFRRSVQQRTDYSGVYPTVTLGTGEGNAPAASIGPSLASEIAERDRQLFEYLYNDLLGRMESVTMTYNSSMTSVLPEGTPRERSFASNEISFFVQDDWKIRRNLTLNVGLRYDVFTPPREQDGFQSVLDQASLLSGSTEISDIGVAGGDKWYSTDWKNFAPRAGFAWDIRGTGSLVLRGGYGMYYDRLNGAITRFVDANSYGLSRSYTIYPNADGTDRRLSDGVPVPEMPAAPAGVPPATREFSVALLDPDLRTPRVDQFNVTLEKRLWGAVFELGYTGTRGTKLFQYADLNQTKTGGDFLQAFQELQQYRDLGIPVSETNTLVRIFGTPIAAFEAMNAYNFDTGQPGIAANELDRNYYGLYAAAGIPDSYIRNFPQFDRVLYGSDTAKSWYDSFQFGIRKSSASYQLRFYYTWSKSLDTVSSDGDAYVSPSDSFAPEADKAPSDFDRKHVLDIAFNYAFPFGRDRDLDTQGSPWLNRLLGGWNLGMLYIRESGRRFSVFSGRETRYAGVGSLAAYDPDDGRPAGAEWINQGIVYWFNPDEADLFLHPSAGESGNIGRNFYSGPGYATLDAVLHKKFFWGESRHVQFRAEAFNLFNTTNFGLPVTTMDTDGFGTIRSTRGAPRALQLGLLLGF